MSATLAQEYRDRRANDGGIVGQRALWALRSARAILRAESDETVRFRWEHDECPDLSWLEPGKTVDEVLVCILETRCCTCGAWGTAGSLHGICDPDASYRRGVEADLALEHYGITG